MNDDFKQGLIDKLKYYKWKRHKAKRKYKEGKGLIYKERYIRLSGKIELINILLIELQGDCGGLIKL